MSIPGPFLLILLVFGLFFLVNRTRSANRRSAPPYRNRPRTTQMDRLDAFRGHFQGLPQEHQDRYLATLGAAQLVTFTAFLACETMSAAQQGEWVNQSDQLTDQFNDWAGTQDIPLVEPWQPSSMATGDDASSWGGDATNVDNSWSDSSSDSGGSWSSSSDSGGGGGSDTTSS